MHKWKCHSDTLFIMFEAHCRYGKYAKNVIKSYTFQGCFSEWLRERILAPFSLILDSFWRAWGFPKWPNSHPRADQKNVGKKNGELLGKGPRRPGASGGDEGGGGSLRYHFVPRGETTEGGITLNLTACRTLLESRGWWIYSLAASNSQTESTWNNMVIH